MDDLSLPGYWTFDFDSREETLNYQVPGSRLMETTFFQFDLSTWWRDFFSPPDWEEMFCNCNNTNGWWLFPIHFLDGANYTGQGVVENVVCDIYDTDLHTTEFFDTLDGAFPIYEVAVNSKNGFIKQVRNSFAVWTFDEEWDLDFEGPAVNLPVICKQATC